MRKISFELIGKARADIAAGAEPRASVNGSPPVVQAAFDTPKGRPKKGALPPGAQNPINCAAPGFAYSCGVAVLACASLPISAGELCNPHRLCCVCIAPYLLAFLLALLPASIPLHGLSL